MYPVCKAHAPYYIPICNLSGYPIFFHIISSKERFSGGGWRKFFLNMKRVFLFSEQHFSEAFLILRRTERDIIINVYWSSCKASVILVRV